MSVYHRNSCGWVAAEVALRSAIAEALLAAGIEITSVKAVCLGMAGADTPEDIEFLTAKLRPLLPFSTRILLCNDAVTALAAGTGGRLHGCVVIAGTGEAHVHVEDTNLAAPLYQAYALYMCHGYTKVEKVVLKQGEPGRCNCVRY